MTVYTVGPDSWQIALTERSNPGGSGFAYHVTLPAGLDGPPGVLHGGLATTMLLDVARASDQFGAPVTRVSAALRAPTPLGVNVSAQVHATDAVGVMAVTMSSGDVTLVAGEVELAGHEPQPHAYDLASLHAVAFAEPQPQERFATCWVCGHDADPAFAQGMFPGWIDDETVVSLWAGSEGVADAGGMVDPVVVGAIMDCPATWACRTRLAETTFIGPVLARFDVHYFRAVPCMEPLRVVGRLDHVRGRKFATRAAVLDDDGVVYAVANALHIAVPRMPTGQ